MSDNLDASSWEELLKTIPFDGAPPPDSACLLDDEFWDNFSQLMESANRAADETQPSEKVQQQAKQPVDQAILNHLLGWHAKAGRWVRPFSSTQLTPCSPPASLDNVACVPFGTVHIGDGFPPGFDSTLQLPPMASAHPPAANGNRKRKAAAADHLHYISNDGDSADQGPSRPVSKQMRTQNPRPSHEDLEAERRMKIWKRKERQERQKAERLRRLTAEAFEKANVYRARSYGMDE